MTKRLDLFLAETMSDLFLDKFFISVVVIFDPSKLVQQKQKTML